MKRSICVICVISVLFIACILASCTIQEESDAIQEESPSYQYTELDEEVSQLLQGLEISNYEKNNIMEDLANYQLDKAEKYQELLKQEFQKKVEQSSNFFNDVDFSLDDAKQSLEDYCDYLKNEYESNAAFFQNYSVIKYEQGSASSSYLAWKKYECAKSYADKLEYLYNDIASF